MCVGEFSLTIDIFGGHGIREFIQCIKNNDPFGSLVYVLG